MRNPNPVFSSRSSERLLCAWALLDDRWLDDLPVALSREHFQDARFGALYEAICATRAKGLRATPDTLEAWAANSGIWEPNELFTLSGEGRSGSISEFESAARAIITAANGRLLLSRIDDAQAYVLENTNEDPAVLFTTIEALFRTTDVGAMGKLSQSVGEGASTFIERLMAGQCGGLRTGYESLDHRHGSFMPGELVIAMGESGSGKTTVMCNIARGFARKGYRGHLASYEMTDDQLYSRMLAAMSYELGGNVSRFAYRELRRENRGGVERVTLEACRDRLSDTYKTLHSLQTPPQTLEELEASVRATKRMLGGLDFVVVDYIQLMRSSNPKAERHLQVAEFTRGLKAMAMRHGVVVVAGAQINRENVKRHNKRPLRTDAREGASIEHDADIILGCYREARHLEMELEAKLSEPAFTDAERTQHEIDVRRLEDRIEAKKHDMEVLSLKVRMGEEGVDHMRVLLPYDVMLDAPDLNPRVRRAA